MGTKEILSNNSTIPNGHPPNHLQISRKRTRRKKKRDHQILNVRRRRRFIPWASVAALLVTWIGLFLFSTKLYVGMLDLEEQSQGLFKFLIPYLEYVRQGTIIACIVMVALTLMMVVVGFFATIHCDHCYRGRMASCVCSRIGSRLMCGLFWTLSYLLNLCWMFILSFMVVMTSAYFAFLPVCLPQSGTVDSYCLNFTILSNLIAGSADANMVNLLLCGGAIDKLCKLTKAILPWYWGAYLGCLAVLLGLSHFNGSLAANFAHGKHAVRYSKIRDRTSTTIKWTKDWRVKSLVYYDLNSNDSSAVSIRTKSTVKPSTNGSVITATDNADNVIYADNLFNGGHLHNGRLAEKTTQRDSTSCSSDDDTETESELDVERQSSPKMDTRTSNGSIVLSVQRNGNLKKVLALPAPPLKTANGDLKRPPTPPYKSRPTSLHANSSNLPPTPPYRERRPASVLSQQSVTALPLSAFKEVRV